MYDRAMEQHAQPFLTNLQTAAAHAHEVYTEFQGAGFTEEQALRLVMAIVSARQEDNPNG